MPQLAIVAKNAIQGVKRHSPIVLTGFAILGVVSTAVLTARATTRANATILEYEKKDNGLWIKASVKEKFRLVWPIYIPPVVTGLATIACTIGAQSINTRRQAALMGAFTLTEGAFQEYKEQVAEALTKPQKDKIETAIAQRKLDENPPSTELLMQADGKVLVLDLFTGRYFRSTQETIRMAQNDVNERLTSGGEMYVSLNEFYSLLGLEQSIMGEVVGFNGDSLVDVNFNTAIAEGGVPCLTITFRSLPMEGYDSLH
jgi:hypothetical protein